MYLRHEVTEAIVTAKGVTLAFTPVRPINVILVGDHDAPPESVRVEVKRLRIIGSKVIWSMHLDGYLVIAPVESSSGPRVSRPGHALAGRGGNANTGIPAAPSAAEDNLIKIRGDQGQVGWPHLVDRIAHEGETRVLTVSGAHTQVIVTVPVGFPVKRSRPTGVTD